jgi:hypothetical protein
LKSDEEMGDRISEQLIKDELTAAKHEYEKCMAIESPANITISEEEVRTKCTISVFVESRNTRTRIKSYFALKSELLTSIQVAAVLTDRRKNKISNRLVYLKKGLPCASHLTVHSFEVKDLVQSML